MALRWRSVACFAHNDTQKGLPAAGANAKPPREEGYAQPKLAAWLSQNTAGAPLPTNTRSNSGDDENEA